MIVIQSFILFSLSLDSWPRGIVCFQVLIVSAAICFLNSLSNRCLIYSTTVTWQVMAVGSIPVAWITKFINLYIYSCKVSFAASDIEWILVSACIVIAMWLNYWQSIFLTAFQVEYCSIHLITLYMMPSASTLASCNSDYWVKFTNFSTWTIQTKNDLSPFHHMPESQPISGCFYAVTSNLDI